MAKFQDKHLKLRYNQRSYFGDNDDCSIWHDGVGMRISCTISGVDPQEDYHLTTKYYVDNRTFLNLPDTPSTYSGTGEYFVTVAPGESGLIFTSTSGIASLIDHGDLSGLDGDDHELYVPTNGSRGFTNTVSGIYPVQDNDLVTKEYVDDQIGGFVTLSGTQTITGDKTFDNTLTTFLGDVFFDGIDITMSGTTLNTESNTVFNYDSTSTINNEGDTNYLSGSTVVYEGGSTVTFSGTTNFDSTTVFNAPTSGICHSDLDCLGSDDHEIYVPIDGSRGFTNTVSGINPTQDNDLATKWYVDQATDMHKETGREALSLNDSSKAIVFGTAFGDTNYSISCMLNNTVDSNPAQYPMIITNRTSTGFTVLFSGDIDSSNYYVEWIAVDDD